MSALRIALGMLPLPFHSIGVFVVPFMQEFGWKISHVMSVLLVEPLSVDLPPLVGGLGLGLTA